MGKGRISGEQVADQHGGGVQGVHHALIGGLGIWVAATRGMATQFTFRSLFPAWT